MFGDTALWLALAIWAKKLTGSSAAAGMVMFCLAAPQLLAPLSGMVVDRVRRRPLLIAANLATAVAVLPLLLVNDRGDVWILYAVTAAYGVSFSVLGAGESALLATMLPADELADANGVMQTAREGLRLVAPLAGAALFTAAGGAAVVLLDVATFVVAAARAGAACGCASRGPSGPPRVLLERARRRQPGTCAPRRRCAGSRSRARWRCS